ncbi:MAG: ComEC/Rec2 family competence protein, partial [Bacteroidales bacterium]|nr:ComEC/Rec2 family competence protein [Bacteroidales bacterium]
MKALNEYPLYRLLIPMILGIITASIIYETYVSVVVLIILFLLFSLWVFRHPALRQYSLRFVNGIFITILFFLFGYQLLWVKTDLHSSQHYSKIDSVSHLLISVNSPFTEKEKTYKTVGKVLAVYQNGSETAIVASGKLLLYFSKQDFPTLEYGDELLITNKLQPIMGYGNPNEFDYAAYLKQQNIYHQMYLRPTDWIKTVHNSANEIMRLSYHLRDILLNILIDFNFSKDEFAVASAILLGYDDYLDQDLRQLYSGSGAMHILCVSGLHVGIIFLIFNTLLLFIKKYKYGNIIHAILMIFIIWVYALVTGLSPSVFRSATMFSFITLGGILNRRTSTYNSLAASAFVLLISNPYLLFHIGFQLSYMAVLSILFIQPYLSKLVDSKWLFLRKSRDLIAVSIAAQLGTFPLAIYYFHQFPNYFILTNLLVIPLSFIILIGGFANIFVYLIGSGSSYIGIVLTKGLYGSLWFLNHALAVINKLPLAVSSDLYFSQIDTF